MVPMIPFGVKIYEIFLPTSELNTAGKVLVSRVSAQTRSSLVLCVTSFSQKVKGASTNKQAQRKQARKEKKPGSLK